VKAKQLLQLQKLVGYLDGQIVVGATPDQRRRAFDAAEAITMMKEEHGLLLTTLKSVQFAGHQGKCPSCVGWNVSERGETPFAHTADCTVAMAIARAEGK